MKITYRTVEVYVDQNDHLIAIPHGESDKFGVAALDSIVQLSAPYSDQQLELFLLDALGKSFSQKSTFSDISPLERFLNIKGYVRATKNRRLVGFDWLQDTGYAVIPTNKIPKRGYVLIEERKIELGKVLKEGELAQAFREAMELSTP